MKNNYRSLIEDVRPCFDDDRIKFIFGPRYSGKSAFLRQIAENLIKKNIPDDHVLLFDFSNPSFENICSSRPFLNYLKTLIKDGRKYYFLFDQATKCDELDTLLRLLNRSFFCSVFVTSNELMKLKEIQAKLQRETTVSFFLGPISFPEYLADFPKCKSRDELLSCFKEYALADSAYFYEGDRIFASRGFLRKFLYEEVYRNHTNMPFSKFYEASFEIIRTAGEDFKPKQIVSKLKKKGIKIEAPTIIRYVEILENHALIEKISPYTEKDEEFKRANRRYFPLFHQLLNYPEPDKYDRLAKTLVFLSLKEQGYEIRYGKTYCGRIDFVVEKEGRMCLLQVVDYLKDKEEMKSDIYYSFRPMRTSCPRFVISLDEEDCSFAGIKHLNLVDFILGKAPLYLS